MQIHDWNQWQSFRKDRGAPPWIKLHRSLMTNQKWAALTDAEKGQLVSLWIAAADTDGELPDSPAVLRKICQLDQEPNISKFIELGLVTTTCQPVDNQLTTTCPQLDAPEERRGEERREEKKRKENFAKEKTEEESTNAQANQPSSPENHNPDAGANPVTPPAKPQPTYAEPEQLAGYQLAAANPQAVMDFEELYAIWPAKRKKPEAKQAYFRAINRGIKNETMMSGAIRYNRKIEKKPPESENFISALHDWLDSDGWTSTFGAKPSRKPQV